MGIEGEKLVLDYLSRVGDLAHSTRLSAAERRALVNQVRAEIGEHRARAGGAGSDAEVKRILGRIGSPEEVVARATGTSQEELVPRAEPRPASEPAPARGRERRRQRRGRDRQEASGERQAPPPPEEPPAPEVPAGPETPGGQATRPMPAPRSPADRVAPPPGFLAKEWPDGQIGAFVGGLEIPVDLDDRAPRDDTDTDADRAPGDPADAEPVEAAPDQPPDAPRAPAPRRSRRVAAGLARFLVRRRVGGPFEIAAAALLFVGAVLPSTFCMLFGWVLSYWAPRLSRGEAQAATFGMPGLVAGVYGVWLVARTNGYGGEAMDRADVQHALADHWPWLLRGAALASALFLAWRANRPRPAS